MKYPLFHCLLLALLLQAPPADAGDTPRPHDSRLAVDLFAGAPDIVQPVSIVCDRRGRLLVIESHTHFRPPNYKGPPHDRVRMVEDTDGDGKADRFTTFFEGTRATMDIALHPDGSIYLATRDEILRLRDTKGDGKADQKQRIIFLDTKGNYPHNGLSGLAFDSRGNLYFGMGENSGEDYKLIGSDGTTLTGGGEGGNIFWCTADGKKLRRVATGFWNPFGVCTDIFGRMFAVDNDPDSMPPCRLIHVVAGGDYGYQYRYGRSGRHPFQAWNGQLPGTLPMMSGTGEAPCEIVSYESDGLPADYLANLLVASWADHRIERYIVKERGASVGAERQPFVQGGKDFRPVGIAVAPDGSLYVSDWVLSDYNLHGKGAIWHIRSKEHKTPDRPGDPRQAILSRHRTLREQACRELVRQGESGRELLRSKLSDPDVRLRVAALTALIDADDSKIDLGSIARNDSVVPLRALAVEALRSQGRDIGAFLDKKQPAAVRLRAIAGCKDLKRLLEIALDPDPFLRHAAVQQLARSPMLLSGINLRATIDSRRRIAALLANRESGNEDGKRLLPRFLKDADPEVRFLAAKWIADQKLTSYRPLLVEALKDSRLNTRLYTAYATALARIDGRDVNEDKMSGYFLRRVKDATADGDARVAALRLVPSNKLTLAVLAGLLTDKSPALQLETVRALNDQPDLKRLPMLLKLAQDPARGVNVRAEALAGLDTPSPKATEVLLDLAGGTNRVLREEALRGLVGTKLDPAQRGLLDKISGDNGTADLVARVLGKPFAKDRPRPEDVVMWLKRLEGSADAAAGRRVFFHARLAGCYRCHRVDGRGQDIGPDLSAVGRNDRRHILESILQPNNNVPPHYQVWTIVTHAGKIHTGMLIRTYLDQYTYVDAGGKSFKINTRDIAEIHAAPGSIMPSGLVELLTDQEVRDLLAYLGSRR